MAHAANSAHCHCWTVAWLRWAFTLTCWTLSSPRFSPYVGNHYEPYQTHYLNLLESHCSPSDKF